MWPWGHLAAGYLCYRLVRRRAPAAGAAVALAVGTQLPDLIDKPFAWVLPLLPNGRSLAHSLLVIPPLLLALVVLAEDRYRGAAVALTTGYLVHLATDALYPLVNAEWYYLGFLGWPAVPPIEYEAGGGLAAHVLAFELTPQSGFEFLLVGVAAVLWYGDGMPGLLVPLETARSAVGSVRRLLGGYGDR